MNIFFIIEPAFFCLVFLPLPVLAVLLMRSDCSKKKALLQLLLLAALESLGHSGVLGWLGGLLGTLLMRFPVQGVTSAYVDVALMVYRGVMQAAMSLLIWKKIQRGKKAGILLSLIFLPGLFLRMWTTCAMTAVVYGLCIRELLKKRRLEAEKIRFLGLAACICVVIAGAGDYLVNSSVNRQIAENIYEFGGYSLENENYVGASMFLGEAVRRVPKDSRYLRAYALALEGEGESGKAEEMLDRAVRQGLDEDSLRIVQGELAYINGDYKTALRDLPFAADGNMEETLRKRAVCFLSKTLEKLGDDHLGEEIQLLEDEQMTRLLEDEQMIKLLNDSRLIQLADVYFHNEDYEKSRDLFWEVYNRGRDEGWVMDRIITVQQYLGRLEEVEDMVWQFFDRYPENYLSYKWAAFLEAEVQQGKAREEQEYYQLAEWYGKARELYESFGDGGDEEMDLLDNRMVQLIEEGWLSEPDFREEDWQRLQELKAGSVDNNSMEAQPEDASSISVQPEDGEEGGTGR